MKTENRKPLIILGAGMAGLQFAYSFSKMSDYPLLVIERGDRPGGKALGIYDRKTSSYDSSLLYYVGAISHREVVKNAKELGVSLGNGPLLFGEAKVSYDEYESEAELSDKEKQSFEEHLYSMGITSSPQMEVAVDYLKKNLKAGYGFMDLEEKILPRDHSFMRYVSVGGYAKMPTGYILSKVAFDIKTSRYIQQGETENFAKALYDYHKLNNTNVRFVFDSDVSKVIIGKDGVTLNVNNQEIEGVALVNTVPSHIFANLIGGHDSLKNLLLEVNYHRYRGWIVDVEKPNPKGHHVMNWALDEKSTPGMVAGFGTSMKEESNAIIFLQLGVNGPYGTQDYEDDFYLGRIDEVVKKSGMGKVLEVRGKGLWSMGSHFTEEAKSKHKFLESIQGENGIYHCGDYMFTASMSTSMAYAAILSKKLADKYPGETQHKIQTEMNCGD